MRISLFLAAFAASVLPLQAAQNKKGVFERIEASIVQPKQVEPTDERLRQLKLPAGFRITKIAGGLQNTRMLAFHRGKIYVTRPKQGDVLMLSPAGGAQAKPAVKLDQVHGIVLQHDQVFLASAREVYAGNIGSDGTFEDLRTILKNLPPGGQHDNRTLGIGPDGLLYISVGSLSNAQFSPSDKGTAALLRCKLDGNGLQIFAEGLRNTIGFSWHPETRELWGMDHGIDWLGDDRPPEELNKIEQGKHYGWPWVWGDREITPQTQPPPDMSKEEFARNSTPPVLTYTAHSAPMQMVFYTGDSFPRDYRNNAFVAMRGSWNRKTPSGYEIVRIHFPGGKPARIEPFVTGFVITDEHEPQQFARLAGITQTDDGALITCDDSNGVLYRISYSQAEASN